MLHSSDLKKLPPEEVAEALKKLSPAELEELQYDWGFWARPNQLAPEGDWKIWMALAGRGWGKSRVGSEWTRHMIRKGFTEIGCVAPTKGDVRAIMVEGPSGLLNVCWKGDKTYKGAHMGFPTWSPTNNTMTWENGAKARFYSAEDPERLRGPNLSAAWCFIADTQVATPSGNKNVQSLDLGDLVITSSGFQPIIGKANRVMPVGTVRFSNGVSLTGTYEHPVWTQRGWVNLGELKESDTVCAIDALSGVVSGGIPTITTTTNIGEPALRDERTAPTFTGRFMKRLTDLFQKVSMFTISTVTSLTTIPQILKLCPEQTTCVCTNSLNLSSVQTTKPSNTLANVMTAAKMWLGNLRQRKQSVGSANTKKLTKLEKLRSVVPTAKQNFSQGWETSVVRVVSTWAEETAQTVYNIKVANVPEYYANGILTHNCDELASWNRQQETWDMLQMTLRIGKNPQIFISTTPKPSKLIIDLHKKAQEHPDKIVLTSGSSYENKDNINLDALSTFEGTRLGRQELYAEILMQAAGALWGMETLANCQIDPPKPEEAEGYWDDKLVRVVVAIDPAMSDNSKSDETGICVAGIDINGKGYVLEDATGKYSPQGWALKAIDLYHKYKADRIVYETNQGKDLIKHTIKTEDPTLPLRGVHAKRSKHVRAEPVSALYEQGKVFHVTGTLEKLETQMTTWVPTESMASPDALDACVYALTDLMLNGVAKPKLELSYSNAQKLLNL